MAAAPRPTRRWVAAFIALWICNSALCVLLNKHILFYRRFTFPCTLAVSHMTAAALSTACVACCMRRGASGVPGPGELEPVFVAQLAGIATLFGLVLVLANSAFMYLSVPSIQMLKASGAVTTFCVGMLLGTERYSHFNLLKVLVVGAGVFIASYGDVKANLLGVLLQVGSIVADAVRCTLLQLVMQHARVKLSPLGTLLYVSPLAALALCLPAGLFELPKLSAHAAPIPWLWLAASCAATTSLNLVGFTLICGTSALTTSVTGPLKDWIVILLAMAVYGTPVTRQQWGGYAVALAGIAWYQRDKFWRAPAADDVASGSGYSGGGDGGKEGKEELLPLTERDAQSAEDQSAR
ncbi:phosphate phosphoenolpyruvate translocator [Raphidocelis subcapitata]|uniref:Phosphate phosphoenolpyruvate translocator n=1 Tax=Raphidocelis subcapitata TaxID=307507 RepID=A0A2V0NK76_9CHLO|nr:phosphate phosphoenolpyruvate translocator [Raphidocelis subcapitata]|eukprot:GBF87379.1 phosphate phosphoenolpyruvate translocator [Raphidocelis subcapitata]